eukprot:364597-Chlamydomonas_euryale.AAC.23
MPCHVAGAAYARPRRPALLSLCRAHLAPHLLLPWPLSMITPELTGTLPNQAILIDTNSPQPSQTR